MLQTLLVHWGSQSCHKQLTIQQKKETEQNEVTQLQENNNKDKTESEQQEQEGTHKTNRAPTVRTYESIFSTCTFNPASGANCEDALLESVHHEE